MVEGLFLHRVDVQSAGFSPDSQIQISVVIISDTTDP